MSLITSTFPTLTRPERWPWGSLRIGAWLVPSFLALAVTGLVLATSVITTVGLLLGRNPLVPLALAATGAALFVARGLGLPSRRWERQALLPSLLLLFTVWCALLVAARVPLLPTLDLLCLGLAVQLAVARLGCTLAGSCYGLPASWGLVAAADCGRPPAGVRRLPVALLEASGWLLIALAVALALAVAPIGIGFGLLLLLCGLLRSALEPLRGEPVRQHWFGLRPAQIQAAICLGLGIAVLHPGPRGVLMGQGSLGPRGPSSTADGLFAAGLGEVALLLLGGVAVGWLLVNRGRWTAAVRRLTEERRQGLKAFACSLLEDPPRRQVRLHQVSDLQLGVSRQGGGPSRHWRISVMRPESSLSRAEAEWALEAIATALTGATGQPPAVLTGAAGQFLILLPDPASPATDPHLPLCNPADLQRPDYYLPLLPANGRLWPSLGGHAAVIGEDSPNP